MAATSVNKAIEAEQELAEAVQTLDEDRIAQAFARIDRSALEFTGRCFSLAICKGLVRTSVLFAENGFCLNVEDEPVVASLLAEGTDDPRGLREFLGRYAYCKARRTYYFAVVAATASLGPLRSLLDARIGLTERDCAELLSLAVRFERLDLAELLVEHGASLVPSTDSSVPSELQGRGGKPCDEDPWVGYVTPQHNTQMLSFLLEQVSGNVCPIPRFWFTSRSREDEAFADRLALIVFRSAPELCEDKASAASVLARFGKTDALACILAWDGVSTDDLAPALAAAQEAGQAQAAAMLIEALHGKDPAAGRLTPLS